MSSTFDISPDNEEFVWLQFETKYLVPDTLCCLAVCGSIQEIGHWDVRHAAIAEERPKDSGRWTVMIFLPTSVNIEWKWVVLHRHTHHVIRWEERYNRWYHTGYQNGRILAPWNKEHTFSPAPSGNGMEWDQDDSRQLEDLIHCLENETDESDGTSLPLQPNQPGVFRKLSRSFVVRFWGWYNFLQESFRNLLHYLYSIIC